VRSFAYIYLAASITVFLYGISIYMMRFFKTRAPLDLRSWIPMVREALPFGLAGFFAGIFSWINPVALSYLMGNEAVGWYSAAFKLTSILAIIPSVVNMSFFPAMCRFYITSKSTLLFMQQRSLRYMTFLGLPIGVGTTLIADKIIFFVYGPAYANSAMVLQILVWSSVLAFISSTLNLMLSTSNMQMIVTKQLAICAIICILLSLLLIPYFSYVGAAISVVAAEIVSLILAMRTASKVDYRFSGEEKKFLIKIALANAVMAAFIIYTRNNLDMFLIISSSAIIYLAASYLFRIFDENDKELFRNVLKRM